MPNWLVVALAALFTALTVLVVAILWNAFV